MAIITDIAVMARLLVLFAHPALEKSRVHKALLQHLPAVRGVTFNDLYEQYPDLDIDIEREQQLLLRHDTIILQHPFYWYSSPAILKQWMDLVLEHGWAYGREGRMLHGKRMLNVISAGGSAEAYSPQGRNRYPILELLRPFELTARLCGMDYLPPFVIHGTHRISNDELEREAHRYRAALNLLAGHDGDAGSLPLQGYLNDLIID